MSVEVGEVLEGKVTGITKFGAFVALPEGRSGLVHISEVAHAFVSDVGEYLSVGQPVRVRVVSVAPDGKINLSIKRADEQPRPPRQAGDPMRRESERPAPNRADIPREEGMRGETPRGERQPRRSEPVHGAASAPSANSDFEDRLQRFMKESDSRMADSRVYAERPRRNNRRGK